jgi:hypothetical protein
MSAFASAIALPVTEEAVAAYRELAAASPDRYRPDLTQSLTNLSRILTPLSLDDAAAAASADADRLGSSSSEA